MPKPILQDADHFDFVSLAGERLDLWGSLVSWTSEGQSGAVEKLIVKRAGAIHQTGVGAPPRRLEYHCVLRGPTVRADRRRVEDVFLQQPEGDLTDPRLGRLHVVINSWVFNETPGDERDVVYLVVKASESGLKDPPKPAAAALAQQTAAQGASVASQGASVGGVAAQSSLAFQSASAGFLLAMTNADTGAGTLLDVDANLTALSMQLDTLNALSGVTQDMRRAAALAFGAALQARNAFVAGRPPIITYTVSGHTTLSNLAQTLYPAARAAGERDLMARLNTIPRPYSIPAGTKLLLSDPAVDVQVST